MNNEEHVLEIIDSIYDAIDAGQAPGELLRTLAKKIAADREAVCKYISGHGALGEEGLIAGIRAGAHVA